MARKKQITETISEDPADQRTPIQKYLAEIGRKGGLKGGKARSQSLSDEQRSEIASKAAQERWKDHKKKPKKSGDQP